jgi:transcriptional regulator with XRE-family HTH domain
MTAIAEDFSKVCRQWRQFRKLSQLELALAANVSQRHVSWLETGRSKPSREMVLRLSEAMDVPLRERNALLKAAGFSAAYRESRLEDPSMAPVLHALERMLSHHEPLPAMVVDRLWNIKRMNRAAELMLSLGGDLAELQQEIGFGDELNIALLSVHPDGLRRYIANWEELGPTFARRLRVEAAASGDPAVQSLFERMIELADQDGDATPAIHNLQPVLPVVLDVNGLRLSLFSVISTLGTPQDVTADEMRIESFYPADAETAAFFAQAATEH